MPFPACLTVFTEQKTLHYMKLVPKYGTHALVLSPTHARVLSPTLAHGN